jgi:hypothetical protein
MRRFALALTIVALAGPAGAAGHSGTRLTGYVSTVSALDPPVLGVNAIVLGGDDRLRISNYSRKTIVVFGYRGEPYLRFDTHGVWANMRSAAVRLNRFRYPPPLPAGTPVVSAPPRWRKVGGGVTFEWHDHRIHWTSPKPPHAVAAARDEPHLIRYWRIPGRANGKPFAIRGFLGYVPPARSGGTGRNWRVPVALGVLGIAAFSALGLAAAMIRRKSGGPAAPGGGSP